MIDDQNATAQILEQLSDAMQNLPTERLQIVALIVLVFASFTFFFLRSARGPHKFLAFFCFFALISFMSISILQPDLLDNELSQREQEISSAGVAIAESEGVDLTEHQVIPPRLPIKDNGGAVEQGEDTSATVSTSGEAGSVADPLYTHAYFSPIHYELAEYKPVFQEIFVDESASLQGCTRNVFHSLRGEVSEQFRFLNNGNVEVSDAMLGYLELEAGCEITFVFAVTARNCTDGNQMVGSYTEDGITASWPKRTYATFIPSEQPNNRIGISLYYLGESEPTDIVLSVRVIEPDRFDGTNWRHYPAMQSCPTQ